MKRLCFFLSLLAATAAAEQLTVRVTWTDDATATNTANIIITNRLRIASVTNAAALASTNATPARQVRDIIKDLFAGAHNNAMGERAQAKLEKARAEAIGEMSSNRVQDIESP